MFSPFKRFCFGKLLLLLTYINAIYALIPLPAEDQFNISLDGTWRFKLEQGEVKTKPYIEASGDNFAQARIELPEKFEEFYLLDYNEDALWHDINVPSNWEIAGYSPSTFEHPDNASAFYRKAFIIPADWQGRIVKVNFDGVQNGAEIWFNGYPVSVDEPSWGRENYHESGFTAWQADLTKYVKFGQNNLLALRVSKNTKSSDLDDGDFYILGGIYRPVKLFSVPQTHIKDFTVRTHLLETGDAEVKTFINLAGKTIDGMKVSIDFQGEQQISQTLDSNGNCEFTQIISHPRLWSAEFPNLYKMVISLKDSLDDDIEQITRQIGIREVTIKNGVLLVNGTRIKLTGMCCHQLYANQGASPTETLMLKDLKLMKEANVNAIRTSHYPYDSRFYDLCDKMGFYLIDEVAYCWLSDPRSPINKPGEKQAMVPSFAQRARETVARDKNHASVIIWGIGNENMSSEKRLQVPADIIKEMDPTRPRLVSCQQAELYNVEMDDFHYPTLEEMKSQVNDKARRAKWPIIYSEHPNVWDVRRGADYGSLDLWTAVLIRTWDIVWNNDTVPGSFLWEWQDRAVADKCLVKLYDFDSSTGIGYRKIKGIVDSWRNPRPGYYAVKMVYSPIKINSCVDFKSQQGSVILNISNRYSFTNLSEIQTKWYLLKNGKYVAEGIVNINLAPLTTGKVSIYLEEAMRESPDVLRLEFNHPQGWNIMTHQFEIAKQSEPSIEGTPLPELLRFPKLNIVGYIQLHTPVQFNPIERFAATLRNIKFEPSDCKTTVLKDIKSMEADIMMSTDPPDVRKAGHVKAVFDKGVFNFHIDWMGQKTSIQELGWIFEMPASYDHFSWNRHAIWSYYPQTNIGRPSGTATPDSAIVSLTRIERPDAFDFISTKYNCKWACLTNEAGKGLYVQFAQAFAVRADFGQNGCYQLVVNKQCSPPKDIASQIVPDFYMELKKGDSIDGSFIVGSK